MNKVLIIGAGRSSGSLINYLLSKAKEYNWTISIADMDFKAVKRKINKHPNGRAFKLDVYDDERRQSLIEASDLVISMMPAFLHSKIARDCLRFNKHLITASYVSKEMSKLAKEAHKKGLIFMGEMGLDPGIDHMSAMKRIHEIQRTGGEILEFHSYTGGLIAPESLDNPWKYKFTWNPRNVVLAGQGTAQYIENGNYKYIPYSRLFESYKTVEIQDWGPMEMYANRDSLLYRSAYNLRDIPTLVRGTLRYPGFCDAWDALVQIGLTDDSYPITNSDELTYRQFIDAYTEDGSGSEVEDRVAVLLGIKLNSAVMDKLRWMGLFEKKKIKVSKASPAEIVENLLLDKWRLKKKDKDLILMQHEFVYKIGRKKYKDISTMILIGKDSEDTAMSRVVGLPLGIFVKNILLGKVKHSAIPIPVRKKVYLPLLKELQEYGVVFKETTSLIE